MSTGNLNCKVTPEYMVWRAKKVKNMVIPLGMEDVQFMEESSEMPSEFEIAKQIFEKEKKKMRIESCKQQKKAKKWKELAEAQKDRLCKISVSNEESQKNYKMLDRKSVV